MDDLLTEFLTETSESLAVIDSQMVEFEKNPNNSEILGNIFRLVHTIKGTCGFLGLPRLEKVAHAGENVLDQFRGGELEVSPEAVTLILTCIDTIRDLMAQLEETGSEPDGEDADLIAELNLMADGKSAPAAAAPAEEPAPEDGPEEPTANEFGAPVAAELLAEVSAAEASGVKAATDAQMNIKPKAEKDDGASDSEPAGAAKETKESSVAASSIRVNVELLEGLMTLVSELVLTRNQLLQMVRGMDDSEFNVPLQRLSHITSDLQEGVMKTRMQPIGNAWAKLPRIVRDLALETSKKIDLRMLGAETELDRQVLELIKDPLTHMVRNSADHGLEMPADRAQADKPETGVITLNAYHEGGHIIIEIADDGRGLNMDRIRAKIIQNGLSTEAELEGMSLQHVQQFIFKPGFSTAEKVTSVSGRGVGMDVVRTNIEMIGGTIELKSEEGRGSTFTIKIPLTLAIVSALIVECGGERFAVPQISVLELVRASSKGENVIELVNESPVLRLRNRLLPLVSLQDLLKLESTDKSVTVEKAITATEEMMAAAKADANKNAALAEEGRVAASVKVEEAANEIAMAEAASAKAATALEAAKADDAADPTLKAGRVAVAEAAATAAADVLAKTKAVEGTALTDATAAAEQVESALAAVDQVGNSAGAADDELFIIVSQVGTYTFGIVVDRVFDTEEIVVKPVAPILRDVSFYSGNTILGDGSVIMILDPNGIASVTGQTAMGAASVAQSEEATLGHDDTETTSMLIFRAGGEELKAVPLALIARLEEIDINTTEKSHGQYVVQYRGNLMPLIPFDQDHEWKSEGRQPILVFTDRERNMGLVVDEIVDIVEDRLNVEIAAANVKGLVGSAVIDGKATDVIDAGYYLTQAFADWFGTSDHEQITGSDGGIRVLLIDDSSFFRNLLTPVLSAAGYRVTTVDSAAEALALRDKGSDFDVIVTDIEMPEMDGFDFANTVREDQRWSEVPLVALSSHATDADFERGRDVGFNEYVAKFDRENLIATLAQTVASAAGSAN